MNKVETDNQKLFDALFAQHYRPLYAYLLGLSGERTAAEDLLQETFVRAWTHIHDVRAVPEPRRRYWLMSVAKRIALDMKRRQAVRRDIQTVAPLPDETICSDRAGAERDPAHVVAASETAAAVDRAIAELPETLRTVLALHTMADLTSAEIGQLLDRPDGTVRYQLARARRQLAQSLARAGHDDFAPARRGELT